MRNHEVALKTKHLLFNQYKMHKQNVRTRVRTLSYRTKSMNIFTVKNASIKPSPTVGQLIIIAS